MGKHERDDRSHQDVEDLGVFEWIEQPGEEPAFVEDPGSYITTMREKMRDVPPKPLVEVDYRVRWEVPALLLWLVLSAVIHSLFWWTMLGLGMIAFSGWMRPALRRRCIVPLAYVYGGFGVGQLLFVASQVFGLEALRVSTMLYGALLLVAWMAMEIWYLFLSADEPIGSDFSY